MTKEQKAEEDVLFLGLTRPPMVYGVTHTSFAVILLGSVLCLIITSSWLVPPIGIASFFAVREFLKDDLFAIDIYVARLEKRLSSRVSKIFKCVDYEPW